MALLVFLHSNTALAEDKSLSKTARINAIDTATTLTTGDHSISALRDQVIHPYTDLLLHDMGEELADNRPDFEASGTEWRTPPLWAVGLTETVLGTAAFLHDGRARTLEEAILWHGGEAEVSRERFRTMVAADRDALILFLISL